MTIDTKPLLMRANRLLGASLVDANLVSLTDLEKANDILLDRLGQGGGVQSNLLAILVQELRVLSEQDLLTYQIDHHELGLVDIRSLELPDDLRMKLEPAVCWATWTIPFDQEDEYHYLASSYYLSSSVRTFWEKLLPGKHLWFLCPQAPLAEFLERLEQDRSNSKAVAA